MSARRPPLRYWLNPCDMERHPALVRVGDALAWIWDTLTAGTDCACCLGARVVALVLGTAVITALLT